MKKLIQICSLLSLVVLFGAGAAFAQSGFGTDVNIPFNFTVGDRSYEAGDYVIKLEKLATGSATLSIEDTKTEEIQRVLLNVNGDAASGEIKLVFDTINGQRRLTKVRTPDRTYAIVRSKSDKNAEKASSQKAAEAGGASIF